MLYRYGVVVSIYTRVSGGRRIIPLPKVIKQTIAITINNCYFHHFDDHCNYRFEVVVAAVDSYLVVHWELYQVDCTLGTADLVMIVVAAAFASPQPVGVVPWKTMVGSCTPFRSDSDDSTSAEEQMLPQKPRIQEDY